MPGVPWSARGPLVLREGERTLSFLSTIATFGTAVDVTLSELSIEAFYPANAQTAMRMLSELGAEPPAQTSG